MGGVGLRNCQVTECHLASLLTVIIEAVRDGKGNTHPKKKKKMLWVMMFIVLHDYYQHCHFHSEFILCWYCEHDWVRTIQRCVV